MRPGHDQQHLHDTCGTSPQKTADADSQQLWWQIQHLEAWKVAFKEQDWQMLANSHPQLPVLSELSIIT